MQFKNLYREQNIPVQKLVASSFCAHNNRSTDRFITSRQKPKIQSMTAVKKSNVAGTDTLGRHTSGHEMTTCLVNGVMHSCQFRWWRREQVMCVLFQMFRFSSQAFSVWMFCTMWRLIQGGGGLNHFNYFIHFKFTSPTSTIMMTSITFENARFCI